MLKWILLSSLALLLAVPLAIAAGALLVGDGFATGIIVGFGVPLFVGVGMLIAFAVEFAGPILLAIAIIYLIKKG
ncbi:MAG TPA: hypothetical protein VNN55_07420 [bacterium]|nr:hypothetical protein [bacterium]